VWSNKYYNDDVKANLHPGEMLSFDTYVADWTLAWPRSGHDATLRNLEALSDFEIYPLEFHWNLIHWNFTGISEDGEWNFEK
jgi:hypothetical protein